jgi:hypothetical protein
MGKAAIADQLLGNTLGPTPAEAEPRFPTSTNRGSTGARTLAEPSVGHRSAEETD